MRNVLQKLNLIGDASGKAKTTVAKTFFPENTEVSRVVKLALDPMITFNVGKKVIAETEKTECGDLPMPVMEAERLLNLMASRSLTGNALKKELLDTRNTYCESSWEMFRRVMLKDLRIGAGEKLFNDIQEKFIKIFAVNLAHKYERKRIKSFPVAYEIKHDGVRVVAVIDLIHETARFFSRTGKEFTSFDHLVKPALQFCFAAMGETSRSVIVIDGEVISGTFNKTVSEVRKKDVEATDAILMAFEVLSGEEFFNGCTTKEERRRKRAEAFFDRANSVLSEPVNNIVLIEQKMANSFEEIDDAFDDARENGHEGIIVKPLDEIYQNKRTYGYLKVKAEDAEDLIVTDIYEGEYDTKYKGMAGGAIVKRDNDVLVRVGGGWSDRQRAEIWADFTQTPVTYRYKSWEEEKDCYEWIEETVEPKPGNIIGRVIEVGFHEETPDGSLRHPRFNRFRDSLGTGSKE